MYNLVKDDYDENIDDIMKSINKMLSEEDKEKKKWQIQN